MGRTTKQPRTASRHAPFCAWFLRSRTPNLSRPPSPCTGALLRGLLAPGHALGTSRLLAAALRFAAPRLRALGVRLARKGGVRCGPMPFPLQSGCNAARSFLRGRVARSIRSPGVVPRSLRASAGLSLAPLRRRKLYSSPPGFRQANRHRLFCGAGPVLPFPDMVHLFFNEFSSLRGRSFALALVSPGTLQRLLFKAYGSPCSFPFISPSTFLDRRAQTKFQIGSCGQPVAAEWERRTMTRTESPAPPNTFQNMRHRARCGKPCKSAGDAICTLTPPRRCSAKDQTRRKLFLSASSPATKKIARASRS